MINNYRYDVFGLADEDATNKLIIEGIHGHCSRCSNFVPEVNDDDCRYFADGQLTRNSTMHLIRCAHFTACLETLNREGANKK